MPQVILPRTFVARLAKLRSAFTMPSFDNFLVLVCGAVHALGKHRITDFIRAAGSAAHKHYCSYFRFFSHGRWSLDELGLLLLGVVLRVFPTSEVVLVLDDTLVRRSGKKVALGSMHSDPLLRSQGRPFSSYDHVFVVLAVHVRVPGLASTGWALPFLFRLFRGPRHGGRKDSPRIDAGREPASARASSAATVSARRTVGSSRAGSWSVSRTRIRGRVSTSRVRPSSNSPQT
ncbi:MAG: transposase [bacterium]|nr:transposase [bacterium]